jgi:hypothetical protein
MNFGTGDTTSRLNSVDEELERLHRKVLELPGGAKDEADQAGEEADVGINERSHLGLAMFELEMKQMHRRLQISDILVRYVRDGARTLSEVQQAISARDLDEIMAICEGTPLSDVLLDG